MDQNGPIVFTKLMPEHREQLAKLLRQEGLPADDLPPLPDHFFAALHGNDVIGGIGLEVYGGCGLLRSMVVAPAHRGSKVAAKLVTMLEEHAAALGIRSLYLLTETAAAYFERKDFCRTDRVAVPPALRESTEFSHVCPQSAIVMKKDLSGDPVSL